MAIICLFFIQELCFFVFAEAVDEVENNSINAADLLKTHITGIINHGHGGFHTYVNINEYPQDPNLTINVILNMLKRTAENNDNSLQRKLYLQADNCWRENKNRFMLAFCELLVSENIFREVHLSFLIVGHTHEDVDAAFSRISDKLRTVDAETFDDLLDLLPKTHRIKTMFDVKGWLKENIEDIQKLTQPLHYKFKKVEESTHVYFKGQSSEQWTQLNGNILTKTPNGSPNILMPDYSRLDIDAHLKQINNLWTLFKKQNAVQIWKDFFEKIQVPVNTEKEAPFDWILNTLPRQPHEATAREVDVIPEVREKILKETDVPKVTIRKRQRKGAAHDKKNGGSKKKRFIPIQSMKRLLIPSSDEEKKHIWFKIIFDLTGGLIMYLLLLILYLRLFVIQYILDILVRLFLEEIYIHMACSAASAHICDTYFSCQRIAYLSGYEVMQLMKV